MAVIVAMRASLIFAIPADKSVSKAESICKTVSELVLDKGGPEMLFGDCEIIVATFA